MNSNSALKFVRTDSSNADFRKLIRELDADLQARYLERQTFFDQFNSVEDIRNVIIVYDTDGSPVGCGAFKKFDHASCEIKRMYIKKHRRGCGIGKKLLHELEKWAKETGFTRAILETGNRQPEAISAYTNSGYEVIDNYGPYVGVDISICMEKML